MFSLKELTSVTTKWDIQAKNGIQKVCTTAAVLCLAGCYDTHILF